MKNTELSLNQTENTHSYTMKSIPKEERPYEKCLEGGAESLSDAELLAVILRTGAQGESALELSRKILAGNEESSGLLGIYHMSISDLKQIRGVGDVKAVQIQCIAELSKRISRTRFSDGVRFHDPVSVAQYYMEEMRHLEQEILMLVLLDAKGRLIRDRVISKGTARAAIISPREIFIEAVRNQAVSILLLHNHPSGIPDPSEDDIVLTQRIRKAGELIGIELLDHIIIGDCMAVSMREQGFWQEEA